MQQDHSDTIEAMERPISTPDEALLTRTTQGATREESTETSDASSSALLRQGFDWLALLVALLLGAFFALTARFNTQPSPSYIPAAVFSAPGCGLLVTAIRKLRGRRGAGLLEAGLSGLGLGLLQFLMTFTYPGVFQTVIGVPEYSHPFLVTWGLVALFAVLLSLAGATIGHLAFAPLRPLPASKPEQGEADEDEDEDEADEEPPDELAEQTGEETSEADEDEEVAEEDEDDEEEQRGETFEKVEEDEGENEDEESLEEDEDAEDERMAVGAAQTRRTLVNYLVTALLLSLLPMMGGYVFAATYDFILGVMNVSQVSPALYPTLSLLSGMLPWRLAAPITLVGDNGTFIVFTLLWRIPDSVLGNPNLFDVQALEALVFSSGAFALLLTTLYGSDSRAAIRHQGAPWRIFLLLLALSGLLFILPSDLWLLRGLEGVLQISTLFAQLPTIQLINPTLFVLNLLTGVLFSLIIGLIVRRQYQLWTLPRALQKQSEEDQE